MGDNADVLYDDDGEVIPNAIRLDIEDVCDEQGFLKKIPTMTVNPEQHQSAVTAIKFASKIPRASHRPNHLEHVDLPILRKHAEQRKHANSLLNDPAPTNTPSALTRPGMIIRQIFVSTGLRQQESNTIQSVLDFADAKQLNRKQKIAFVTICFHVLRTMYKELDEDGHVKDNGEDHRRVLEFFDKHCSKAPMCMLLLGEGGCGKSWVVKCVMAYFENYPGVISLTATTGAAAVLIGDALSIVFFVWGVQSTSCLRQREAI